MGVADNTALTVLLVTNISCQLKRVRLMHTFKKIRYLEQAYDSVVTDNLKISSAWSCEYRSKRGGKISHSLLIQSGEQYAKT